MDCLQADTVTENIEKQFSKFPRIWRQYRRGVLSSSDCRERMLKTQLWLLLCASEDDYGRKVRARRCEGAVGRESNTEYEIYLAFRETRLCRFKIAGGRKDRMDFLRDGPLN